MAVMNMSNKKILISDTNRRSSVRRLEWELGEVKEQTDRQTDRDILEREILEVLHCAGLIERKCLIESLRCENLRMWLSGEIYAL